jgi:hypothetical protein
MSTKHGTHALACIQSCLEIHAAKRLTNFLCTFLHAARNVTVKNVECHVKLSLVYSWLHKLPNHVIHIALCGGSHSSNRMMGCHKTPASFMVNCIQSLLQPCKLCTADATIPGLQICFPFVKLQVLLCFLELLRALHRRHVLSTFTCRTRKPQRDSRTD